MSREERGSRILTTWHKQQRGRDVCYGWDAQCLPRERDDERLNLTCQTVTTWLVQRTLSGNIEETIQCHCGRICKNLRGMKIHQAKSNCKNGAEQEERTAAAGEMVEDHSQEQHHSTEDLQSTETHQEGRRGSTGEPDWPSRRLPRQPMNILKRVGEVWRWPGRIVRNGNIGRFSWEESGENDEAHLCHPIGQVLSGRRKKEKTRERKE